MRAVLLLLMSVCFGGDGILIEGDGSRKEGGEESMNANAGLREERHGDMFFSDDNYDDDALEKSKNLSDESEETATNYIDELADIDASRNTSGDSSSSAWATSIRPKVAAAIQPTSDHIEVLAGGIACLLSVPGIVELHVFSYQTSLNYLQHVFPDKRVSWFTVDRYNPHDPFDVVFLATIEHAQLYGRWYMPEHPQTDFITYVHQGDEFMNNRWAYYYSRIVKYRLKNQVLLLTLQPHVIDFIEQSHKIHRFNIELYRLDSNAPNPLTRHDIKVATAVWPSPQYKVKKHPNLYPIFTTTTPGQNNWRRRPDLMVADLLRYAKDILSLRKLGVVVGFYIMGRSKIQLPSNEISKFTHWIQDPNDFNWYRYLRSGFAWTPYINWEAGYNSWRSSTVPLSSLNTFLPMVVDQNFLSVYRYYDRSMVWLMRPGETELQTVIRFLSNPNRAKMLNARKRALKLSRDRHFKQNVQTFIQFINRNDY